MRARDGPRTPRDFKILTYTRIFDTNRKGPYLLTFLELDFGFCTDFSMEKRIELKARGSLVDSSLRVGWSW